MNTTSPEILTPQRRTPAENVTAIKESLGDIAQGERERVAELYTRGKERVRGVELRVEDFVREQPLRSVALAVGVGAALGFLLGRRR
jgi:ElaB/YqjD/DUF883 family membrane-anchored ribosome-binding protein